MKLGNSPVASPRRTPATARKPIGPSKRSTSIDLTGSSDSESENDGEKVSQRPRSTFATSTADPKPHPTTECSSLSTPYSPVPAHSHGTQAPPHHHRSSHPRDQAETQTAKVDTLHARPQAYHSSHPYRRATRVPSFRPCARARPRRVSQAVGGAAVCGWGGGEHGPGFAGWDRDQVE